MNTEHDDAEITPEQIRILNELGVQDREIEDMSAEDADALIDELRAEREEAERYEET